MHSLTHSLTQSPQPHTYTHTYTHTHTHSLTHSHVYMWNKIISALLDSASAVGHNLGGERPFIKNKETSEGFVYGWWIRLNCCRITNRSLHKFFWYIHILTPLHIFNLHCHLILCIHMRTLHSHLSIHILTPHTRFTRPHIHSTKSFDTCTYSPYIVMWFMHPHAHPIQPLIDPHVHSLHSHYTHPHIHSTQPLHPSTYSHHTAITPTHIFTLYSHYTHPHIHTTQPLHPPTYSHHTAITPIHIFTPYSHSFIQYTHIYICGRQTRPGHSATVWHSQPTPHMPRAGGQSGLGCAANIQTRHRIVVNFVKMGLITIFFN